MALDIKTNIPVVSTIIERYHNGKTEVLVQTRWKPGRDPVYSGTLEIPAGWIDEYESVYDALKREVLEETGLVVTKIKPDIKTSEYKTNKDDSSFAFLPFCCQQQLKGGKPWVGFVFLCEVEDSEPKAQAEEVRDVRWIEKDELESIFIETPEKIFTLHLGVLDYYFSYNRYNKS
jgi:8-oxo-dGTP pyrophosphatase MutT (NUDIX family)